MKVMIGKEWYGLFLVACVVVLTLVAWGWSRQPETETAPPASCSACERLDGSDACCAAEKCAECDPAKGSPDCRKTEDVTEVAL